MKYSRFAFIYMQRSDELVVGYSVEVTRPHKGSDNWQRHNFDTMAELSKFVRRFKKIRVEFQPYRNATPIPIETEQDWIELILSN